MTGKIVSRSVNLSQVPSLVNSPSIAQGAKSPVDKVQKAVSTLKEVEKALPAIETGIKNAKTFTPPKRPGVPAQLRSCSSRRARLWAGGTYFRSRELGLQQNKISVQVIQFTAPDSPAPDAICVVTNYNIDKTENVVGPATAEVLRPQMKYDELVKIEQLDTTPRARKYSISAQIAPPPPVVTDLGAFSFSALFHTPGLLSVKLTPSASVFAPTDEIVIQPRYRVYRLETISVTDPDTQQETLGWDIAKLRAAINANDPWVEMKERSGPTDDGSGGPPIPNPNPEDVQDDGSDAKFLTPFDETFLSGGDGLPDSPNNEVTGPTRSIVHVNYGEAPNGELKEVNVVYNWVGESATEGQWQRY